MGTGGEGKGKGGGLEGSPFRVGIGPPEGLIQHCIRLVNVEDIT